MGLILSLETTSANCSVALAADGILLKEQSDSAVNVHASRLTVLMESVLHESDLSFVDLDAVAVSMGPGSYTGLRIGTAAAKGLCYAIGKPLIAVPTLQALAWGMKQHVEKLQGPTRPEPELFCPMIDARRMEVYCGLYNVSLEAVREVRAEIIHESSFAEYLSRHPILFGGPGADKCKLLFTENQNAIFLEQMELSAKFLIPFSEEKYIAARFENLSGFEPFYLKDFIAGKPKVKGLK